MNDPLPMKLTVQVTATNGSTLLRGLEALTRELQSMRIPKQGQVFEGQFWRTEVTGCVDRVNE